MHDFEKIIDSCLRRASGAISGVVGERLQLTVRPGRVVDGHEFLEQMFSDQVMVSVEVNGRFPEYGALIVNFGDAIRLAGRLIMLPPQELEAAVAAREFEEETKYAFIELAKIIGISFTKTLREQSAQACHFLVRDQQVIDQLSSAVDRVAGQLFYLASASMTLGEREMGELILLIPPLTLGVDLRRIETDREGREDIEALKEVEEPEESEYSAISADEPKGDLTALDNFFLALRSRIADEFAALFGTEVKCDGKNGQLINRYFLAAGPMASAQVGAHLVISGEFSDGAYLLADKEDAIKLASSFVALPQDEIEAALAGIEFFSDIQDGFSEITGLIAGVCTRIFDEQYNTVASFQKQDIIEIDPLQPGIDSFNDEGETLDSGVERDELQDNLAPQVHLVYPVELRIFVENAELGSLQLLFPGQLADFILSRAPLEAPPADDHLLDQADESSGAAVPGEISAEAEQALPGEILLVSDSEEDEACIRELLDKERIRWRQHCFRDDLKHVLPGHFAIVFLVSKNLDEQAFGVAIKISSYCSLPLIVASSKWTQSAVFRAVRYGVADILLTPASGEEVLEKIRNNIEKLAA